METDVWRTRLCAEESLTQRYVIAGVAGWNLAVFLLGAMKVAWLSSKLRWPLQFSIAVLVVVGGRQTRRVSAQTETESCQHPVAPELLLRAVMREITFVGCSHFVMSALLIPSLVKWVRWRTGVDQLWPLSAAELFTVHTELHSD